MKKAVVIGSGFGGLSIAALLGKSGYEVTLLEKNDELGGRARVWKTQGYVFDMGPSWYLMPEVFDQFFESVGEKREDYFETVKLDTYYRIFHDDGSYYDLTSDHQHNREVFERLEENGAEKLDHYLESAAYKYDIAMKDFLYKEYKSIFSFFNARLMTEGLRLNVLSDLNKFVEKYFKSTSAKQILEYAMVFLGSSPYNAPALYSIMSHVDLNLGVWYPKMGMNSLVSGFEKLGEKFGVKFVKECEVSKIVTENGIAKKVLTNQGEFEADLIVANADLHHVETELLEKKDQSYSEKYWKKKVMAPSMLIAYLGVSKEIKKLTHHNLYFTPDWNKHFSQIFDTPEWPEEVCYYVSCTAKTDKTSAPAGKENIFILVPLAPGLNDDDETREALFDRVLTHLEKVTGENIRDSIEVKRLFSHRDFENDYNAYKGTGLGMAHTLDQTAVFRPQHQSKKVKNLFYTGQYNHPGVGVPMVLISSIIAAEEIEKEMK